MIFTNFAIFAATAAAGPAFSPSDRLHHLYALFGGGAVNVDAIDNSSHVAGVRGIGLDRCPYAWDDDSVQAAAIKLWGKTCATLAGRAFIYVMNSTASARSS